jgi:hypothetical protein
MNALLLVGSNKLALSASESLGTYLCEQLRQHGLTTETRILWKSLKTQAASTDLLAATDNADIIILACPLFADSLSAPVIKALEMIAQHRRHAANKPQQFLAIVNSGFPEAAHNDVAVAICAQFARQAGFQWVGGLRVGGGGMFGGQPLSPRQPMARNIVRALDLAAEALANRKPVPTEALELAAHPNIPRWLYMAVGTLGWMQHARQNKNLTRIGARPYTSK